MRWGRRRGADDGRPRVTVYSRPGCHLCEQAEEVVAAVCAEVGERYEVVMIDDDPRLSGVLPRSAAPWYPVIE